MKVIFNGVLERKTGGCSACGKKAKSTIKMVTSKDYILPSGTRKTFRVGQETEVSEQDGEFLLKYLYTDPKTGEKRQVFGKCS